MRRSGDSFSNILTFTKNFLSTLKFLLHFFCKTFERKLNKIQISLHVCVLVIILYFCFGLHPRYYAILIEKNCQLRINVGKYFIYFSLMDTLFFFEFELRRLSQPIWNSLDQFYVCWVQIVQLVWLDFETKAAL